MTHWLDMDRDVLIAELAGLGCPGYRASQVWDWLHAKRVDSFERMANLPAGLRTTLAGKGDVRALREVERRDAADGLTSKWLFAAGGGKSEAYLESVLIIEKKNTRRTVCLSSMVGCPLGCVFCATGRHGYKRDLTAGEMLEQVYRIDSRARELPGGSGVSHVVFMGMGEPLLNLGAVLAAARRLIDPSGLGLSGRHVTISTVGVPEGIRRLAAEGANFRLALSLHAPEQGLREQLLPAARRWRLDEVFDAVKAFAGRSGREVTIEYCLVDKVNSTLRHAGQLLKLLRGLRCKVNLIPLNPVEGYGGAPPPAAAIRAFQEHLEAGGVRATVRMEKGRDIGAACGQLAALPGKYGKK